MFLTEGPLSRWEKMSYCYCTSWTVAFLALVCRLYSHAGLTRALFLLTWKLSTWRVAVSSANPTPMSRSRFVIWVNALKQSGQSLMALRQGSYTKIFSKFTNFSQNPAQKSNMKICNSSTHLVKGHIPYCSQRLMHSDRNRVLIGRSKLIGSEFFDFVILHSKYIKKTNEFWSWKMQFLTNKPMVFPQHSEDHKIHTFTDPPQFSHFQGLEKCIPFPPNFQRLCEHCQSKPLVSTTRSYSRQHGQILLIRFFVKVPTRVVVSMMYNVSP